MRDGLDRLGIEYRLNPRLVRGLDYYTHTAFEFVTSDLGAQGTVMGGGRYDGLVEMMGGPAMPGVGWAAGIERLAMLIAEPPAAPRPVAVVPMGEAAQSMALNLAEDAARGGAGRRARLFGQSAAALAARQPDQRACRGADRRGRNEEQCRCRCAISIAASRQNVPLGELLPRLRHSAAEPGRMEAGLEARLQQLRRRHAELGDALSGSGLGGAAISQNCQKNTAS